MVEGGLTVFDGGLFVVGERDADEHALEVRFRLQELTFAGLLGDVEVAPGAGHPVRALLEERVAAETVAEVVVLPGLPGGGGAVGDCVTVDEEDFDGADVAGEVAGVVIGLGERVRGDLGVVLGRFRAAVPSQACSSNSVIGSLAL